MVANPQPQTIRLILSDGTERLLGPWGVMLLPPFAADGSRLEIQHVELVFSNVLVLDNAA